MKVSKKSVIVVAAIFAVIVGCNLIDGDRGNHNKGLKSGPLGADGAFEGTPDDLQVSDDEIKEQLAKDYSNPNEAKDYYFYLDQMSLRMAQLFYREASMEDLVRTFKNSGIEPYFMNSQVRETHYSTMRTRTAWPGAYNVEVNFSGPSTKLMILDNFAFHFHSRTNQSFAEAEEALENAFGGLGDPYEESDVNRAWRLPDGYILNIRYLSDQEIRLGDAYNTYTEEHRGSVTVTLFRPNKKHEH
ncbi:MAG: hypothetical protein AAF202_04190 [Pseudomonadota bacterium]